MSSNPSTGDIFVVGNNLNNPIFVSPAALISGSLLPEKPYPTHFDDGVEDLSYNIEGCSGGIIFNAQASSPFDGVFEGTSAFFSRYTANSGLPNLAMTYCPPASETRNVLGAQRNQIIGVGATHACLNLLSSQGELGLTSPTENGLYAVSDGEFGIIANANKILTYSLTGNSTTIEGGTGTGGKLQLKPNSSYTIVLPSAAGTAGQSMVIDTVVGSVLTMKWVTPSGP